MNNERIIKVNDINYVGSIPSCIALESCDLGEAAMHDGTILTTAFGKKHYRFSAPMVVE